MKLRDIIRLGTSLLALISASALSASCGTEGDPGAAGGRAGSGNATGGAGSGGFGAIGSGGSAASAGVGGSSGAGISGTSGSGGTSGQGGSSGFAGSSGNGGSGAVGPSVGDASLLDADFTYDAPHVTQDACAAETARAEKVPLDIYVMYDQSTSMTCPAVGVTSRWGVITPAFQSFLSSSQAAGIGVGIQYFGQGGDCNAGLYYNPDVPIAPLPGNLSALTSSLQAHATIGINLTTTNAALVGAVDQAKTWKSSHQSHVVAVLLVTDGQPNACGTVQDVVTTAANGLNGTPSIRTFVLGVVASTVSCPFDPNPPNVNDLNSVANAGGTNQAYVVDPAASGAAQQLLTALDDVRATLTVPCQYQIPKPSGGLANTSQVEVSMTAGSGTQDTLTKVSDQASCTGAGGWYFDSNTNPTALSLCPATCQAVTADIGARIDVTVGCIRG